MSETDSWLVNVSCPLQMIRCTRSTYMIVYTIAWAFERHRYGGQIPCTLSGAFEAQYTGEGGRGGKGEGREAGGKGEEGGGGKRGEGRREGGRGKGEEGGGEN